MNVLRSFAAYMAVVGCGFAITTVAVGQTYQVLELSTPAQGNSIARGLNNVGSVAGRSGTTFATQTVAFMSRGAKSFEIIGTLVRGDYSSAFGINDLDQVVGASNTLTSLQAFLWEPSTGMQPLGLLPGDNASQAFAINNNQQVVGYSSGPTGMRPFLWTRNGGMQYLGTLEGQSGMALAISDAGYVVGHSQSASGQRAFFWSSNGGMVDLGTLPGHVASQAMGVNNKGVVVGFSSNGTFSAPVRWDADFRIASLPLLAGGQSGRALGINNVGQMVGFSTSVDHGYRAVSWGTSGAVRDLNTAVAQSAGVFLAEAQAINDRGQILAYGFRVPADREFNEHDLHERPGRMFLLTPMSAQMSSGSYR